MCSEFHPAAPAVGGLDLPQQPDGEGRDGCCGGGQTKAEDRCVGGVEWVGLGQDAIRWVGNEAKPKVWEGCGNQMGRAGTGAAEVKPKEHSWRGL